MKVRSLHELKKDLPEVVAWAKEVKEAFGPYIGVWLYEGKDNLVYSWRKCNTEGNKCV